MENKNLILVSKFTDEKELKLKRKYELLGTENKNTGLEAKTSTYKRRINKLNVNCTNNLKG